MRPARIFSSVDLPEPVGPTRPAWSPTNLPDTCPRRPQSERSRGSTSIRHYACLRVVSLSVMLPVTAAAEEPLVRCEGGIGATPAAIAGGALVINTTIGVPPGGRPWVI